MIQRMIVSASKRVRPPKRDTTHKPSQLRGGASHQALSRAVSRSLMRSFAVSMPTQSRMVSSPAPASLRLSEDSWEWVVEAGWMISERTSPRLASSENSWHPSTTFFASSNPPLTPNVSTAPPLPPMYLSHSALYGLLGRAGYETNLTLGCFSSHDATSRAFWQCLSIRRARVSTPVRVSHAIIGAMHEPRSRSATACWKIVIATGPNLSANTMLLYPGSG
mmetsp:Transcript_7211/g.14496  ORF Transcript_7211/g.14496 Transcript_7211/m.14496 type:complete len:221 (-) Transcript_7211:778-1440(-)